ncbi:MULTISPECIES: hypothetical protein [Streptomyces]|uniref:PASTA domain-containing protein n=1 Tax=Streptomyces solicathayae TaxID=3081768 RepID=A0ABZ0LPH7_9ACTN|nr:hypothetical protein [Streptomyces sp. HUAS YS2]WOX21126.1 hypothetical protein R2D22_06885 [Streptomyces sp. HUAS YS2]
MRRGVAVCAIAVVALAAVFAGTADETDEAEPGAEPVPMPDLTGRSLLRAFAAFDHRTRVHVHDVSGGDRRVLWPSRWRVCTQHPVPGSPEGPGRSVTLGVVRKTERCPSKVLTARR